MRPRQQFFLTLAMLCAAFGYAQDIKFGKITSEELEEKIYPNDSTAPAAVLYRDLDVRYHYNEATGFQVITAVHERIKIYDQEGFDYATIAQRLYQGKSKEESLSKLKGYTYNLVNGEVEKTKLKGSDTFSRDVNKYYKEETFTMPQVKEGSVIEYQYNVISPYSYSLDDIVLQYDIPIREQHIKIAIPEYYSFKTKMKGYLGINPSYGKESGKINFTTTTTTRGGMNPGGSTMRNNSVDYFINTTTFSMKEVPALEEEPFVNDMDNYRSVISYELQQVRFPGSAMEDFSTSWEKVVKTIYDSDNFGRQMKIDRYYKDVLPGLIADASSEKEKMAAVFKHVQEHMTWNSYNGYFTDKGVKEAYEEKSGNIADINLMLISMLRSAGIEANPVLVSTRDNGIPLFPTVDGFNYVIAAAEVDGARILLDAANSYTKPNLIRTPALNWDGKLVKEDGTILSVSLFPTRPSADIYNINVEMDAGGDISGKMRIVHTEYRAYGFRNSNNSLSEEEYLEDFENEQEGLEVVEYDVKNSKAVGKPVMENLEFIMENQANVAGDKIYFAPLFYHALTTNPFKREERNYPIDFNYPWQEKYMLNISIPEGFEISSYPESVKYALPNDTGSFIYRVGKISDNHLQVVADIKINRVVIPSMEYAVIKKFFKNIIEKEAEQVVLTKITSDEHTGSAAGGR
ncbi:DUF3857 domain-containing protein [Zeaxanthinibacter enoshimensis]|uniref:Transglutaminase superfamily protein n=1 Tax=Zeaxanthinibacter enoshimensis TaxID=392009 RepID=A0A4R6TJA1_9FLAO|nr:DUF3857 domain-containing protein [Zeaxanthinibacter enoshimensis]TDQ30657.1 transglutaminase superfamily protein [Zeaxanthinibacter enoshimensis]